MELHQYWVFQEARLPVAEDQETFVDQCNRVQRALQKSVGVESCATFSTPHSFRGEYAEIDLSCVVVAEGSTHALWAVTPVFIAALQKGDFDVSTNVWWATKVHRLSALPPETKENTNG